MVVEMTKPTANRYILFSKAEGQADAGGKTTYKRLIDGSCTNTSAEQFIELARLSHVFEAERIGAEGRWNLQGTS